ncbi:MAG: class I SAM-dependent methyltransferase [Desulfobacterota bacterium]|nr:class I SAM-dependent methyltransferase [Thermodesulfobacteriota bacterium]
MSLPLENPFVGNPLSEHELCPDELLAGQEAAFQRDIDRLRARSAEFVAVACPACGSAQRFPAFEKYGFIYDRCASCLTIYMNPRPSPQIMEEYYRHSENYAYWAHYIFPASEQARQEKIHRPWLGRVLRYCDQYGIATRTLLEIGPGFGTFAALARESGRFEQVIAVEPTPEMADACRKRGIEVINKRIEDVTENDVPEADVVVSFEVIEHLFAPREFLVQCSKRIGHGGLLVVSCPNGLGFDISMLGAKALAVDPEHVNFFNPRSLSQLVAACGFDVLEVTTPGRLDAEFVHDAILKGVFDISHDPFLKRVMIDEWDRLGWPFQQFLAENGLSSHMWLAARKRST